MATYRTASCWTPTATAKAIPEAWSRSVRARDDRFDFYTDIAFPAGKTVWIYVGVSNRIFATLNDVSIDASIDSRWQLSSLAITTV